MELVRLVYRSESTGMVDWPLMRDIFSVAELNNADKGVTGILVNSGQAFLQVLEGEKSVVRELYNDIAKDDRHQSCEIHALNRIAERRFGNWKMRGFDIEKLNPSDKAAIKAEFCDENGNLIIGKSKEEVLSLLKAIEKLNLD